MPMKEPRTNPLSEFSSYTYNISLYLISPESYNQYATGGALTPSDWILICQSGGIGKDPRRAKDMPYDYYIDNLRIKTLTNTHMNNAPINNYDFNFQIFEPYGFKFPTELVKATRQMQENSSLFRSGQDIKEVIVSLQAFFILVVRFYGYDKDGNIVKNTTTQDSTVTDSSAALERSFPITISKFDFRLSDKMVVYDVEAKLTPEFFAYGRLRGVLGKQVTLQGNTVGEMLAKSDGKTPGVYSLTDALNAEQKARIDSKQYKVVDEYEVKFAPNSGIDTSKLITTFEGYNKAAPLADVQNSSDSNPKTASNSKTVNFNTKPLSLTDQPIVQVIDKIVTQSEYITKAFNQLYKEITQPVEPTDKTETSNPSASSYTLQWYNITPQVEMLKADSNRGNINGAKITYIIQPHKIPNVRGFNIGKKDAYPGPYKRYQHTFLSGQGKEIISFEQNYNLLYFNLMGENYTSITANFDQTAPGGVVSMDGSSQGKVGNWFGKAVGPVKSFLYGPATQMHTKMTILGDPDYLMTACGRGFDTITTQFYGEDGWSINPTTGQIFVEIDIRDASDYNENGTLDVAKANEILFYNYPSEFNIKGFCLEVWQVVSTFNRGTFTQELSFATAPFFPNSGSNSPQTNNTAETNPIQNNNSTNVVKPTPTTQADN